MVHFVIVSLQMHLGLTFDLLTSSTEVEMNQDRKGKQLSVFSSGLYAIVTKNEANIKPQ